MKKIKKFLYELFFVLIIYLFGYLYIGDENEFFGVNPEIILFYVVCVYLLLRISIGGFINFVIYRITGTFRGYPDDKIKLGFENYIYKVITFISFILILMNVMRIAFIFLLFIFGILWILSTLTLNKQNINNGVEIEDEEYKEDKFLLFNNFTLTYQSLKAFNFFKTLTDNTFGILNNYGDEYAIILIDKFHRSNYLKLVPNTLHTGDENIFCGIMNSYMNELDIKCKIKPKELLDADDEKLMEMRVNNKSTLYNDLSILDKKLNKKRHHIICITLISDTNVFTCVSIVNNMVYKKLNKFR